MHKLFSYERLSLVQYKHLLLGHSHLKIEESFKSVKYLLLGHDSTQFSKCKNFGPSSGHVKHLLLSSVPSSKQVLQFL